MLSRIILSLVSMSILFSVLALPVFAQSRGPKFGTPQYWKAEARTELKKARAERIQELRKEYNRYLQSVQNIYNEALPYPKESAKIVVEVKCFSENLKKIESIFQTKRLQIHKKYLGLIEAGKKAHAKKDPCKAVARKINPNLISLKYSAKVTRLDNKRVKNYEKIEVTNRSKNVALIIHDITGETWLNGNLIDKGWKAAGVVKKCVLPNKRSVKVLVNKAAWSIGRNKYKVAFHLHTNAGKLITNYQSLSAGKWLGMLPK